MKHYDEKQMQENILYLEALSEQYPNIQSAAAEVINLHAERYGTFSFRYSR